MNRLLLMISLLVPALVQANTVPKFNPFSKPALIQQRNTNVVSAGVQTADKSLPIVRATLVGGKSPLALIGENVIAIGQKVAGYELVAVREGVAIFKSGNQLTEVRVNNSDTPNENSKENSDVE